MAQRQNVYIDSEVGYVLKNLDGSAPSLGTVLASLGEVKKARKQRTVSQFLFGPPADVALSSRLDIQLPNGSRALLQFNGAERSTAFLERLRQLCSNLVASCFFLRFTHSFG